MDVDLPAGTVDRSLQVDGDDDEELIDDLGHALTVVEMRIDPDVEALTGSSDLDGAALRLARRGQIHAAGADPGHCVDGLADDSATAIVEGVEAWVYARAPACLDGPFDRGGIVDAMAQILRHYRVRRPRNTAVNDKNPGARNRDIPGSSQHSPRVPGRIPIRPLCPPDPHRANTLI